MVSAAFAINAIWATLEYMQGGLGVMEKAIQQILQGHPLTCGLQQLGKQKYKKKRHWHNLEAMVVTSMFAKMPQCNALVQNQE